MKSGGILPLINELEQSNGVIYIESNMYEDTLKLLEIYAAQSASAISNAFLHSMVNIKNEELGRTYNELRKSYIDTIEALRLTVDAKDEYTLRTFGQSRFSGRRGRQGVRPLGSRAGDTPAGRNFSLYRKDRHVLLDPEKKRPLEQSGVRYHQAASDERCAHPFRGFDVRRRRSACQVSPRMGRRIGLSARP